PNLILQPLLENAVRHGIAVRPDGGRLSLRAWRTDGRLHLEVADDGPSLPPAPTGGRQGIGLANTRARLQQLYGAAQEFELRSAPGQGVVAHVSFPFREDQDGRAAPLPSVAQASRLWEPRPGETPVLRTDAAALDSRPSP